MQFSRPLNSTLCAVVIVLRVIKIPIAFDLEEGEGGSDKNLIMDESSRRRISFFPRFWKRRRKGRSLAARPEISRWILSPRPSSTSPGTHPITIYGTGRYSVITSDTRNIGNDGNRSLTVHHPSDNAILCGDKQPPGEPSTSKYYFGKIKILRHFNFASRIDVSFQPRQIKRISLN